MISIPVSNGQFALIDDSDYDLVTKYGDSSAPATFRVSGQ